MGANVAVIGCGHWGKNLVRNFSELGHLAAISDPSAEVTQPLADRFSVSVRSLDEILDDTSIDGVAIAAPAPLHADIAIRSIEAGKHVFVEKPVALSTSDANRMIDVADSHSRLLMVGHLLHYHSGFLKVVEMVEAGAVGCLRRIYSNRLSFGKVRTEENVMWSFAPHDISMILRLAGGQMPTRIDATGSAHVSGGIVDFAHVHLGFEQGLSAHVFVSWLNPFKEQKLVVVGEEAMIVFDDTLPTENKVALYRHKVSIADGVPVLGKADAEFVAIEPSEPLKNECQSFVDGMSGKTNIYTDGREGLRVLDVMSQADAAINKSLSL